MPQERYPVQSSYLSHDGSLYSDFDILFDRIMDDEEDIMPEPRTDNKYYIGLYFKNKNNTDSTGDYLTLSCSIHPCTLYKYSGKDIIRYLYESSHVHIPNPRIEIMQLHILPDTTYSVVLKTHWFRLIQRRWRNILQQRKINR